MSKETESLDNERRSLMRRIKGKTGLKGIRELRSRLRAITLKLMRLENEHAR